MRRCRPLLPSFSEVEAVGCTATRNKGLCLHQSSRCAEPFRAIRVPLLLFCILANSGHKRSLKNKARHTRAKVPVQEGNSQKRCKETIGSGCQILYFNPDTHTP